MIERYITFLSGNITGPHSRFIITSVEIATIALTAIVSYYIMRLLETTAIKFISKSRTRWDDDLLNLRFLKALSLLMPAIIVAWLLPQFFNANDYTYNWIRVVTLCYILWTVVYILHVFITNTFNALTKRKRFRPYAIKGIFQMLRLIMIGVGVILTVSILIDRSPLSIMMALGASAAILMLIFKDTILGLVASVQLTANNMLQKGDWIIADRHSANGEVIDISLTTVKVRNWDNSVATIPPYSLISESFVNYQPMRRSGGRRVDRSILIDANSIRFCTPTELENLRKLGLADADSDENATNMHLLRNYLERYLSEHPMVRHDMLTMVRQMDPTPTGLPLQLYFFTGVTEWKAFENIQSDIFDHIYAVIQTFGLRVYQVIADRT